MGNSRNKGIKPSGRAVVKVYGHEAIVGDHSTPEGLIASFVAAQDVRQASRELYKRTLSRFFAWVQTNGKDLSKISLVDVLDYKDYLAAQNLSSLTVSSYLVAVRKFYSWAEANRLYPNIAKGVKTPPKAKKYRKQHLTDKESATLLDYLSEEGTLRNYAIVNLMLRTGIRTIEVSRANIGNITYKAGKRILQVWGKGREKDCVSEDFVVLTDKAFAPIAEYLETRKGYKAGDPLFVSCSRYSMGQRISTRTVSKICKEGLKGIGLNSLSYSAHSLRHTTGCALINHGCSLEDVQLVLRHKNPATTQIYLDSIREERKLKNSAEECLDSVF